MRSGLGLRVGEQMISAVTPGTLGRRVDVVHPGRFEGDEIGVASVTLTAGRNMVGWFAQCRLAMTSVASTGRRSSMSVGSSCPGGGRTMADVTLLASGHVRRRFDLGIDREVRTAVAGCALASQSGVIHLGWIKGRVVLVAAIADGRSRNMSSRALAQSIGVVVASCTTSGSHPLMRIGGRFPGRRSVANIAGLGRQDVFGRLDLGIDLLIATEVTTQALTSRPGVTHFGRGKGSKGGVTCVALGAGWNVD